MGGSMCRDVSRVVEDSGVLPNTRMDPAFAGFLSLHSSARLTSDYAGVRGPLSPEELGAFDRSLRATVGESGRVTRGGVGVVALALSFLFDVLGRQARKTPGSSHFIQNIFGAKSSEVGTVVIDYLKLVPLIANDPRRMKEETERYEQRLNRSLVGHFERSVKAQNDRWRDWSVFFHGLAFHQHMRIHRIRMGADIPLERLIDEDLQRHLKDVEKYGPELEKALEGLRSSHGWKSECKTDSLLDQFAADALFTRKFFFWGPIEIGPKLISQTEDFFY